MKKTLSIVLAGMVLLSSVFAKPAKITSDKLNSWKNVAKISDSLELEVIEDDDDLLLSKSSDGKDFAVFYKEYFDDGSNIQLGMVCADGTMYSRALYTEKQSEGGAWKFTLQETDKQVRFDDAGSGSYLTDFGRAYYALIVMDLRNKIRTNLSKEYGLIAPEKVKKNDSNFRQFFDANIDEINAKFEANDPADSAFTALMKKVNDSNFAN